jgi:NADH-quinone oxidoreductase subunit E
MNKQPASQNKPENNLLVALQQARARLGYLPTELLAELAVSFKIPVSDVYGVASFYSFLTIGRRGRNVIRICRSLPCYLKNSQLIIQALQKEIGIGPWQITPDGRFSFELTNCIGLCDRAPAMLINDDPHTDLTPAKISRILRDYK